MGIVFVVSALGSLQLPFDEGRHNTHHAEELANEKMDGYEL
jgi:hypothetical protein